jgi:hypothetical protein
LRRDGFIGLACLLLVAASAGAQTLPVPLLPPAPEAPVHPRGWEYAIGAGFGYDTNIDFLKPDGPSGFAFTPRAQINRALWSSRGRFDIIANGRWTGYPEETDLNRYYTEAGFVADYKLDDTTTLKADATYQYGYTDGAAVVLQQGVPLPLVKSQGFVSKLDLSRRVGTRTTLRVQGRYYVTHFDSPTLIDGESVRGALAFERQLSPRTTGALVYALEDFLGTNVGVESYVTHFGSFQWTRTLTQRSALLLEAGASYTPKAETVGLERKQAFFGGASYTLQSGLSHVAVFVRREVAPAFGLGVTYLETRVGARVDVPIGKEWIVRSGIALSRPDAPKDPAQPVIYSPYVDSFAAVARSLGRYLEVSGESRYRRRGDTTATPTTSAFQVGVFVTLGPPGKVKPDWSPF